MFAFFKRISLFLLTNLAVVGLLSLVLMAVQFFFPNLLEQYGSLTSMLIYATLFGFGGSIISLFISRWQAKKAYVITLIEKKDIHTLDKKLQVVYETVERIAQAENIKMPEVGYYESAEPNAFATGATKNSALIAVSTGLLSNMKDDEVRGVIGHEMAHILNGDMVTLTLVTGVMNTFVILLSQIVARIVAGFLSRGDENNSLSTLSYHAIYFILQMVFGALAMLVIMWFSRYREYRADLGGAKYTSKSAMIHALKRLQSLSGKGHLEEKHANMTAFMITEPDSLFSTHPALHNRIKALEENYQLA